MAKLIYLFLIVLLLSSCATNHRKVSYPETTQISQSSDQIQTERKVIYSASLTLISPTLDSINPNLERITQKYNGYVNQISTTNTTIRVKSEYFETALQDIGKLGQINGKYIQGNDVTQEHFDIQIRLDNALKTRERYLELLNKTQNVEEAILVERELARISENIDLLKGQLNQMQHLETYATIDIRIREKKKLGILGYVAVGIYKSIKWLIVRN